MESEKVLEHRKRIMEMKWKNVNIKLENLLEHTGYQMVQENGQRVFTAPNVGSPPPRGCEIFVGKLPKDVFEYDLVPLFEKVGPIYRMRLMMEFSGMNRGYCFITYFKAEVASVAVTTLHGTEIRPGRRIGVYKSLDNCRLFVGGVPPEKTKDEVLEVLNTIVEGIKEVIIYQSHANKNLNRGYAFVEFENHRLAAMARRKLSPGSLILWSAPILVDWADPLPEVDSNIMANVTKLYIRKLDTELTNDELRRFLYHHISEVDILKVHKITDYAFVHFITRGAAETAFQLLQGLSINGEPLEVLWARPRMYSKEHQLINPPQHYCMSLPPRSRKQIYNRKAYELTPSFLDNGQIIPTESIQSGPSSSTTIDKFNYMPYAPNIGNFNHVRQDFFKNDYIPVCCSLMSTPHHLHRHL